MLTLTESAKETGLSRTAIFNAIKKGRLSATKNAQGQYLIDPAELFRVYKPINNVNVDIERHELTEVNARFDMMNQLLEAKDQLIKQIESERDDLRRRLDEESRKLTAFLTHQETPKAEPERPVKSLLYEKLFGRK